MAIRCAVVGLGYWGPNIARSVSACPALELTGLCDGDAARLAKQSALYPGARAESDAKTLLTSPDIDAVFLAVPLKDHFPLAQIALQAGKHVFVEKPFTQTSAQALALVELAAGQKRVLMVDHIFVYTSAVKRIREIVQSGELGKILYYDSVRINLGLFQHDTNVLWDLAVHDLAIMDYVFGEQPISITATGARHFNEGQENMAYLTCTFKSGMLAHIHASWLSPVKVRQVLIGGESKMISYNDIEPDEKLKIYDRGVRISHDAETSRQMRVGYRMGDILVPNLERSEALQTAVSHFADCIQNGTVPFTDGHAGLRAIRLLEAANQSMTSEHKAIMVPV